MAQVYFTDGNALLRDCTVTEGETTYYQASAYCMAYVTGVNDGFLAASLVASVVRDEPDDLETELLCVPNGVEAGQLRDIVIRFLHANPGKRHMPAGTLVWLALVAHYSCP